MLIYTFKVLLVIYVIIGLEKAYTEPLYIGKKLIKYSLKKCYE